MTKQQALGKENVIRLDNAIIQFKMDGKDVTLPRWGSYIPRNDDIVEATKQDDGVIYKISDKNSKLQVAFLEHTDGRVSVQYPGEKQAKTISAKDMATARNNRIAGWDLDVHNNPEIITYRSGTKIAMAAAAVVATVALVPETVAVAPFFAAAVIYEAYKRYKAKAPKGNDKGVYPAKIGSLKEAKRSR